MADSLKLVVAAVHVNPERPPLALGMCLAHAAAELEGTGIDTGPVFLADEVELEDHLGRLAGESLRPVLLFSNYVWNVERNLALSRLAHELRPDVVTIHGGPSTPAYEGACEAFLREQAHVTVAVRGAGEDALVELLRHLASGATDASLGELAGVSALAGEERVFRRGPERPRRADLDALPSPYLTGTFGRLDATRWESATLETNRGCPYGCTFCDWGSATLQKLRRFDLERVRAEIEWLTERGVPELWLADANFGILERDLEVARLVCDAKRRTGSPQRVVVNYAKNTHTNLARIVETFVDAGLVSTGIISLQTRDEETLGAVRRTNIRVAEYDKLRAVFAERRLPLTVQLMVGLPGGTLESFRSDLRAYLGEDMGVQLFRTVALPNSPMADPDYVAEHGLEFGEDGLVVATRTCSAEELRHMTRVAKLFNGVQRYGILRLALEFLETEHALDSIDVLDALAMDLAEGGTPKALTDLLDPTEADIDLLNTHARLREDLRRRAAWRELGDAFALWCAARFDLPRTSAFAAVLEAQAELMPSAGRPARRRCVLAHDVAAWWEARGEGRTLSLDGIGPGELVVEDPLGLGDLPLEQHPPGAGWELPSSLGALARRERRGSKEGVSA